MSLAGLWLEPTIFRRIWVISVAVFVTNFSISTVDDHLRMIVFRNFSRSFNCLLLSGAYYRCTFTARRFYCPSAIVRYDMLIFLSHIIFFGDKFASNIFRIKRSIAGMRKKDFPLRLKIYRDFG